MANTEKLPDTVRVMAEQQGLARALKLYPETMKVAAERGLRPLGAAPAGTSPIAPPAPVFDPTRFEKDR
jgi:hypothetical protein